MTAILDKLMEAKGVEEVAEILRAEGWDEAMAQRAWEEVCHAKDQMGGELSLDELDAVAGGVERRDWLKEGCAATVEPSSNCWGTDGGCCELNINYLFMPSEQKCLYCDAPYTFEMNLQTWGSNHYFQYECRKCGAVFRYLRGKWERLDAVM